MAIQCTAHVKTGQQCRRWSIEGGTVCIMHGGSAPQVKTAARRRLLELIDPALVRLSEALNLEAVTANEWAVIMRAIKEVLDRTGIDTPKQIEIITLDQVEQEIMRLEAELAEEAHIVDPGA